MFSNLRSLIFKLDPETAHSLAIKSLKFNFVPNILDDEKNNPLFKTKLFNKEIENPIGMAAGFDKNAEVYNSLFNLGFGFVEVGTVTPLEQYGNPKPRVFRLVEDVRLLSKVNTESDEVIAIDFDGVIHKNSKGYYDGTIYDDPVEGAYEALERLAADHTVIIYTCKAKPDRGLINGKTGTELIWEWLKKHDMAKFVSKVTAEKPRARYYIDDKAIQFTNWKDVMITLNKKIILLVRHSKWLKRINNIIKKSLISF